MRTLSSTHMLALLFIASAACTNSPATGAPAAPSELAATAGGGVVHLTWKDNSTNEIHFMVERKNGAAFQTIAMVPADTTQYDETPASPGTYVYRVTAMAADGETASSDEASVNVQGTAADLSTVADASAPPDLYTGSATCHAAGCRTFSSYCSTTGCACIPVIADNPDPVCAGKTIQCLADPCDKHTAACNHGTGMCVLK